jgi:hypothetical protein
MGRLQSKLPRGKNMTVLYIMPNENALAQAMQQDRTFFELNPDTVKTSDFSRPKR